VSGENEDKIILEYQQTGQRCVKICSETTVTNVAFIQEIIKKKTIPGQLATFISETSIFLSPATQ
jgi:hypothetical protein